MIEQRMFAEFNMVEPVTGPGSSPGRNWLRVLPGLVSGGVGVTAVLVGGLVLVGWQFDIVFLKSVSPKLITMKANVALVFIIAGLSLLMHGVERPWFRRLSRLCAVLTAGIGALTVAEYLVGGNFRIAELLFRDLQTMPPALPGRMSIATALMFVAIGSALLLLKSENRWSRRCFRVLVLGTNLFSFLALIGYAYGAPALYEVGSYPSVALHTAAMFFLISLGVLCASPKDGIVALLLSDTLGGHAARRLIPALAGFLFALGLLRIFGQEAGLYEWHFGAALLVTSAVVVATTLVGLNAIGLHRIDTARNRVAEELRRLHATLEQRVAERTEQLEAANIELDIARQATAAAQRNNDRTESETRLRELANAMPQMVWTSRPDGYLDSYNDRWYDFTGLPRGVGGDASWNTVVHPEDAQKCGDIWRADVRSGKIHEVEFRLKDHRTSCYRWHLGRGVPVRDGAGAIVRWIGTCTDIDDLKKAEEKLRHSEKQFHTLVDSIEQLAWVARPDGYIYWYNKRWYDYTGTFPHEVEGWGWQSLHDPAKLPEVLERWKASIASGEPFDMVFPLRGADGQFRSFLTRIVPLRNAEGQLLKWFGTHTDITERIQMEEGLRQAREELEVRVLQRTFELKQATEGYRQNEKRYRTLVEATTTFVWNAPASGEIENPVPGWAAYTGQTQEEMNGWGWLDAVHPEDREHTVSVWSAAVATRSFYQVEHRVRRHDGEYRNLLGRGVAIVNKEATTCEWVGAHTDVTEQRQAEVLLLKAKQAAESASRAKSEFLANMSHEIRTPMNGVLGMTDLALDTQLTTEQREYLGMVKSSAQSLLTLINDILDFSKIEAGQLELDVAEFELAQSIGGALRTLAIGAQQKGLELACQIAADVPEALVGDSGRLCQVLVNLVGNAIKFTEHGEVVVRVEKEASTGAEVCLHFTVQDTGIGIPPEKQAVIFEAFAQAERSTSRKYGGTGLGLPISAKLVKLMGGRLWVESKAGQGSTFHFIVQLSVGRVSVTRRIRIPPKLEDMPVLVVDNNATNRQFLEEVLSRWKMQPTTASGGAAALVLLEQATAARRSFPLVVLDAHMPDVDGFAVAERIKASPARSRPAVLMLTSSGRPGDVDRCRELGVAARLIKPVAQGDLLEAIVRALHLSLVHDCGREAIAAEVTPEQQRPLRILVAEDNLVNQRLAVGLLEKRGHSVVIAGDGKQALAALGLERFDLMFMDVQMPEMGGYEATALIREGEKQTGKHLPIVATTAYAMKGDRERCLASGMDGYVSKPIQAVELFRAINEALAAWSPELLASQSGMPAKGIDAAASLERAGGDERLLGELALLFAAECPRQMQKIRQAIDGQDLAVLERTAHSFRGSVGNFFAPAAVAAVGELETMARAGVLDGAAAAYSALETALQDMQPALAKLTEARATMPGL